MQRIGTSRRLLATCGAVAWVLHAAAVLWLWLRWGEGLRGGALVWTDLPVSLLYLDRSGPPLLAWSLLLGGLWWALVGAFLAWLLGKTIPDRERPGPGDGGGS